MSNLQPFQFGDTEIRFVGTADKPEWVAADVIAVLYPESNARNRAAYLRRIPEEWKSLKTIDGDHRETPGMILSHVSPQGRSLITITEPGLYHLICRSNSPIAVPFQKWVFEEVLPSIRKTGGYGKAPSTATPIAPGNQHVLEGKNAAFKHYLSKTLNEALLIPGDPHPAAQEAFEKLEKAFESARWDWQGSVPIRMEFYKALINYIIRRNCTSDALLMLAIKIHEDTPQGD